MIIDQLDAPVDGSLVPTVGGHYYTDPQIFALEQEHIFEQMWFCAVLSADLAKPGDWKTVTVGREQLMTIGWFKTGFDRVMAVTDRVLAWLGDTRIWHLAEVVRQRTEQSVARIRLRLQSLLRPRTKRPMEQP